MEANTSYNLIRRELQLSADIKEKLLNDLALARELSKVVDACVASLKSGHKILIAGNGGSAADAQHIAAEFISRFYFDRLPLAAMSLSTDTSTITAIGNDYGYDKLFERQIEAHGTKGDIFIAISTSGKSENILRAVKRAKEKGLTTVALTSIKGTMLADICDFKIFAPTETTPQIQECHNSIGHALCASVEALYFRS